MTDKEINKKWLTGIRKVPKELWTDQDYELVLDLADKYEEAVEVMKDQWAASLEMRSLEQTHMPVSASMIDLIHQRLHYSCGDYLKKIGRSIWEKDKADNLDVEMNVTQDKDGNIVPSISLKNKDIGYEVKDINKHMVDGIEFEADFSEDFKKVMFTFSDSIPVDQRKRISEKFMNILNRISVDSLK